MAPPAASGKQGRWTRRVPQGHGCGRDGAAVGRARGDRYPLHVHRRPGRRAIHASSGAAPAGSRSLAHAQRPRLRPLRPLRATRRDGFDPRRSPRLGGHGHLELDHGLNAGGVTRGAKALLVEHAAVRDRPQHEPVHLATLQHRLDLARDVLGANRGDQDVHQMISPTVSSSANASSATAIRLSAATSAGADVVAKAVRTGTAATGIAKSTPMTVTGASCDMNTTIGTANAAAVRTASRNRVRCRPMSVASVRLPAAASVSMSRRLFSTRIALARNPIEHPNRIASGVIRSDSTYTVPPVATSPKNTNTKSSPSPTKPRAPARRAQANQRRGGGPSSR